MKIIHLTKDYIRLNGITTFIENLVNNDSTNNHYIISNFIEESFLKKNIYRYHNQKLNLSFSALIKNILLLIKLNNGEKIDIIHSHHRYFDLLTYFVSKFTKIKTITTVHSKVYGKRFISYKSDKIIAVGESIKKHLIDYFRIDEKRISVINNFVDPKTIRINRDLNEIKNELKIGEGNYIIGFVGRFDFKEKGIDILLKSSINIINEYKNVIFVFIGDGSDKDYLCNETKNFKDNFRIVETKTDIYNYMQIFDVFVLPSRIDPYPLVMLESAYLRIPFIGSNVDGIAEFVNDDFDGLLFEKENISELSVKTIFLIKNKTVAEKFANNAYKKVIKSFQAKEYVKQYKKIYQSLVDANNY